MLRSKQPRLVLAACSWLLFCGLHQAWAGGSGLNVIVVVNQNSRNSVQLGNEYCQARGVPAANVFRMTNWNGGAISWNRTEFESCLRQPLLGMLAERGLAGQARIVLVSMDIPYRISDTNGQNSTTSALFYGFKPDGVSPVPGYPGCSLPAASVSSYAFSELPAGSAPSTADTNSFLAMMLTDYTLSGAERILRSGPAGDSTFPTQAVYLAKTSDVFRNIRFKQFDNASFDSRIRGDSTLLRQNTDSTAFTNLLGLMTGHDNFEVPAGAYVPGAICDSLTSFGGMLFEQSQTGQTPLLAFLEAGAAASFGTVVEPCAYLEKFPDPLGYFYQDRGFSVAEAYYQSVYCPFQGLMVGEPLCAPFARHAAANWPTMTNGAVLSGEVTLTPSFSAARADLPLAQVDLFVDGLFWQTLTNIPPGESNVLSVTLNGVPVNYVVPVNASLPSVVAGLSAALNAQTNSTQVAAYPTGDRLELESLNLAVAGSDVTLSALTSGGGGALTTWLTPARSNSLDSLATGYRTFDVAHAPGTNDWLRLDIVKTNGAQLSLAVTNTTGNMTRSALVGSLVNLLNATPALQQADGAVAGDLVDDGSVAEFLLYPRSAGWAAAEMRAELSVSTNLLCAPTGMAKLEDRITDLRPRNHLYVNSGLTNLAVSSVLNTTLLPDGFHELSAVAYEGNSVKTQTRISRSIRVRNTGLSASLTPSISGTNVTLDFPMQFAVNAGTNQVLSIQLFSTGGLIGVVSNSPTAVFPIPGSTLGPGVHPFYALVTDTSGHHYRTQTQWLQLVPSMTLSLSASPLTLSWPTTPGVNYQVLSTTNLTSSFQAVATISATGSSIQWPVTAPGGQTAFYRVQLAP
jgi:uncharacterized protein (TIGR03790 family)